MKTLLFVLGGAIVRNSNGTWRSARYTDTDPSYGLTEGYSRAVAAAYLWRNMINAVVVVTGGTCGFSGPDVPFMWSVLWRELLELGVPDSAISVERHTHTTYSQLRALSRILQRGEPAIVISNRYHLPRIHAMLEYLGDLRGLDKQTIEFQAAEDVLLRYDSSRWEDDIRKAYDSEGMRRRQELEQNGIRDLMAGQYVFKDHILPVT